MNLKAFDEIESKFEVESLRVDGICVWPFLKSYLIGLDKDTPVIKEAGYRSIRILLSNLFRDLFSIGKCKKSGNWVFTNSERRYRIKENSFDRVVSGFLNYGQSYVLFENPLPKGRTKASNLQPGEYYMGMSWIFLAQFLVQKFTKSPDIEKLDALENFLDKDLSKLNGIFHRIWAGSKIYDFLIRRYKPEQIFVVCYYSNFELILAAKKNNIPVIEFQHGLISPGHRAYNFKKDYGRELMPDYFFSYGPFSSEIVVKGHIVTQEHVLNYGYFFLDRVREEMPISPELKKIKGEYKHTICITGQLEVTDRELLKILLSTAEQFPNTCFVFKPRFNLESIEFDERNNLIVANDINTYELLKYSDLHITVYSTCAMEALALGTPNISVDLQGYYTRFLGQMLNSNPFNFVVNSSEELSVLLNKILPVKFDESEIRSSIHSVFSNMVESERLLEFLDEVEK